MAERSRVEGGDRGSNAESVLAKSFAWTGETPRPQVVDGGGTLPPRKETKERVRMGAGGGVCIVCSGSAHGRDRTHCPKRERVKEK